ASKEFEEFVRNVKEYDVIECFSYFLNKRVTHNIWKIYFSDESVAYIKILELQDDSSRGIEIKTFDFNPNVGDVFG
ncbi:DUF1132 family protein, partial [Neisseria meningitidis]